ncbi:DUF2280 domain-containing protein [Paraburkholderia sediminicola]|uniref:DUF2280 domain-containing protein n=1 Tax=Paraburkholderia sediminicola TaxID=458836 RepID=UPI0038B9D88E
MANVLTPKQKRFIVKSLGGGAGVMETLKAFFLEYSITLTYHQIIRYDPTKLSGASLSPALKKLFYQSRERAAAEMHKCEMSHAAIRQRRLDDLYLQATAGHLMAENKGKKNAGPDLKLAVAIITESRKNSELFDWDGEEEDEEIEAVKVLAEAKKEAEAKEGKTP